MLTLFPSQQKSNLISRVLKHHPPRSSIGLLTLLKAGHGDCSEDVGSLLRQLPRGRCVTLRKYFVYHFTDYCHMLKIILKVHLLLCPQLHAQNCQHHKSSPPPLALAFYFFNLQVTVIFVKIIMLKVQILYLSKKCKTSSSGFSSGHCRALSSCCSRNPAIKWLSLLSRWRWLL